MHDFVVNHGLGWVGSGSRIFVFSGLGHGSEMTDLRKADVVYITTSCLKKKLCQCYFVNNSVKHWPNLIIFDVQHRDETQHKQS